MEAPSPPTAESLETRQEWRLPKLDRGPPRLAAVKHRPTFALCGLLSRRGAEQLVDRRMAPLP